MTKVVYPLLFDLGRTSPTTRQIAEFLEVDLAAYPEQWRQLPGSQEAEPRDPRQDLLERVLMGALTAGTVGLVLWLVVPGRNLKRSGQEPAGTELRTGPAPWVPHNPAGAYPVVGEVLPEAPLNEEGVLVSLRAVDACEAVIQGEGLAQPLRRSLRVSEPWSLRVKGAFSISLDNAGVVALEVAGRRIRHGRNVGEAWAGSFKASGDWLLPEVETPKNPPTAPETDPINQEVE